MMEKAVRVKNINEKNLISDDVKYWMSRFPEEKVAAVDCLRRQFHGNSERLQRVVRVIQHS